MLMKESSQTKKILLIYRKMIPSILLCGHSQFEYLAKEKKIEYRSKQVYELKADDINWADIVVLGRLDSWYEHELAKIIKKTNKYMLYILDDDLLNIPPEVSSSAYYNQKEIKGYISDMIDMSNGLISPSPILIDKYGKTKNNILIEEPALDQVEYKKHDANLPIKIGFAGSIDRIANIEELLKDVLIKIKDKYKDKVAFEFFGAIPSFAKEIDAKCIPYTDSYEEYKKTLNGLAWDIGLAPMPSTPFYACKHYNKYIEYSASGVVGIYSNVEPYTRLLNLNKDVILCDNDSTKWFKAITSLIDDRNKIEDYRKSISNQEWLTLEYISKDFSDELERPKVNCEGTINIRRSSLKVKKLKAF